MEDLIGVTARHDTDTALHSARVFSLARRVAGALGLDADMLRQIGMVALLHDVGKVSVPRSIIEETGPLTAAEWLVVHRHTIVGAQFVAGKPGLAPLAAAIRASHERWDGNGYPDRLSGESIPLASRITFVCDAYDAMTSGRPYRPAVRTTAALEEIQREAGGQFCPRAAGALIAVVLPPWRMLGRPRRPGRASAAGRMARALSASAAW